MCGVCRPGSGQLGIAEAAVAITGFRALLQGGADCWGQQAPGTEGQRVVLGPRGDRQQTYSQGLVLPFESVLVIQELLQPTLEFALEDGGQFLEHLLQGRHLLFKIRQLPFKPAAGGGTGSFGARCRGGRAGDRDGTLGIATAIPTAIATATGCCHGFALF